MQKQKNGGERESIGGDRGVFSVLLKLQFVKWSQNGKLGVSV